MADINLANAANIHIIILPDWLQPENLLGTALAEVMKGVVLLNLIVPTIYEHESEISWHRQKFTQGLGDLINHLDFRLGGVEENT